MAGFFSFYASSSSLLLLETFPAGGAGSSLWFLPCRHYGLLFKCQRLAFITASGMHTGVSVELERCGFSSWGTVGAHGSGGEVPGCSTLGRWGRGVACSECNQQERCPLSASFLISPSRGGPCSLDAVEEKWVCPTPGVTGTPAIPFPEGDAAITG